MFWSVIMTNSEVLRAGARCWKQRGYVGSETILRQTQMLFVKDEQLTESLVVSSHTKLNADR